MYNIIQLNDKDLSELQQIAKEFSCWEYQGEDKDPVMLKEDLNYQFVVPQTRNYKK